MIYYCVVGSRNPKPQERNSRVSLLTFISGIVKKIVYRAVATPRCGVSESNIDDEETHSLKCTPFLLSLSLCRLALGGNANSV
jgi:hypothetical protein